MDQIILQMGQKMGVKISDEQLDQAIANIAKQNNMTLDQIFSDSPVRNTDKLLKKYTSKKYNK